MDKARQTIKSNRNKFGPTYMQCLQVALLLELPATAYAQTKGQIAKEKMTKNNVVVGFC